MNRKLLHVIILLWHQLGKILGWFHCNTLQNLNSMLQLTWGKIPWCFDGANIPPMLWSDWWEIHTLMWLSDWGKIYTCNLMQQSDWCEQQTTIYSDIEIYLIIKKWLLKKNEAKLKWEYNKIILVLSPELIM